MVNATNATSPITSTTIDEARGHFGKKKNQGKAAPSYATGKAYEPSSSSYTPASKAAPATYQQSPVQSPVQSPLQAPVQQYPAAVQQSPATAQKAPEPEQYSPANGKDNGNVNQDND